MIDHLHGDSTGGWFVEGAAGVAVEGLPGVFVDLGFQVRLQRLVGIVGSKEIRVADEEAFFVVVRVDEPAGDTVGVAAFAFTGLAVKNSIAGIEPQIHANERE